METMNEEKRFPRYIPTVFKVRKTPSSSFCGLGNKARTNEEML